MKTKISVTGMVVALICAMWCGHPVAAPAAPSLAMTGACVPGELIVKFKEGTLAVGRAQTLQNVGARLKKPLAQSGIEVWTYQSASADVQRVCKQLMASGEIAYAEPNYIVGINRTPNDTRFSELWGMHNTAQSGGTSDADIDAPEAWDIETGDNVVVAVIDTGVDYNHPDLSANIWYNTDEIPGNGQDDDGNGYVDDVHGIDACNSDSDPLDDNNHGTHCAGTIAGVGNNGNGVAGVSWSAKIMACKFLSANGQGTTADAIECIDYARINGARVLNNSWGGGSYSQALYDAIERANQAGVLFCAAAGNSAANTDVTPHYPSSYDCANIVAVAASDRNDLLASFSCYGASSVDLAAPGVSILSTVPNNSYATYQGTSMATPHCAGAAALVLARYPALSVSELKAKLLNNVDAKPAFTGKCVTGGRLNVYRALTGSNPPPPPPPGLTNDHCANAMTLGSASGTVNGNNTSATVESGEPAHAGRGPYRSVWWKITPTQNGTLDIDTHGSGFDTVLAVYRGSSVGSLTEVAFNDDDGSGNNNSGLTDVSLSANVTYRIAVAGYSSSAAGAIVLNWTFTADAAPAPTVNSFAINNGADETTTRNVTLNNACSGSPTHYMASESSTFSGATWQTYSSAPPFPLSAGNGTKRVYFKVKNAQDESPSVSDTIVLNEPVTPVNDNFSGATLLSGASGTVNCNNTSATVESGEPAHAGRGPYRSVWWKITPTQNGTLDIDTHGSGFDTVLAVYRGSSVGSLTEVASNDDDGSGNNNSGLTDVSLSANVTYCIAVAGYSSSAAGAVVLNWALHGNASIRADFSAATIQTENMSITPGSSFAYNTTYGGSWRILQNGGGFSGTFTAPGAGSYTLQVVHLSSAAAGAPGGGYSPVTIKVNGSAIAQDWDPAEHHDGSHGFVTDTWVVPANQGQNTVQWIAGDIYTHYWIQSIALTAGGSGQAPQVTAFTINNGTAETTTRNVTLNNTCSGSPTQYIASESATFSGATWQTYSSAPGFTLSTGNGTKRVYIKVKNAQGESPSVSDTITLNEPITPVNDNFSSATLLSGASGTVNGNNTSATVESGEPSHAGYGPYRSVWWKITPGVPSMLTIDTHGSGFDTVLAVYRGASLSRLTQMAANDDDGSAGRNSGVTNVALDAGTTYYIAVAGYNAGAAGSIVVNWRLRPGLVIPVSTFKSKNGKTTATAYHSTLASYLQQGWQMTLQDGTQSVDGPHALQVDRTGRVWRYKYPRACRVTYRARRGLINYWVAVETYHPVIILEPRDAAQTK